MPKADPQINDFTDIHRATEALERARAETARILSAASEGLIGVKASGEISFANPAAVALLGTTADEILGRDLHVVVRPATEHGAPLPRAEWETLVCGSGSKQAVRNELFTRRDGSVFPVEYASSPIVESDEQVGAVVSFRDVTEERLIKSELVQSVSLLRAALEATADGILVIDLEGKIVRQSRRFEEMWGLPFDEVYPGVAELRDAMAKKLAALLANASLDVLDDFIIPTSQERFEILHLDNGRIFEAWRYPQLVSSRTVGSVFSFRDVTERERTQEMLIQSQAQLSEAHRIAGIGRWDWHIASDSVTWSDELYQIFGVPSDVPISYQVVLDRIHTDDRERMDLAVRRAVEKRRSYILDVRIVRSDGEERMIQARGRAVVGTDGEVERLMGVCQDTTSSHEVEGARRDLETQLRRSQKLEAVGRLAGSVAHDFNNLLSIILDSARFIEERAEGHEVSHEAHKILQAGDRAGSLVRRLLTLGRKASSVARVFDPNLVVDDILELARRGLGEHIEVQAELTRDISPIKLDPSDLEHVLINLIVNVRDAMPNGGLLLIRTSMVDENSSVQITVGDTGIGMAAGVVEHIFEPFFSTKWETGATGLGLPTVGSIVHEAGGRVDVHSEPGVGTRFDIVFPASMEPLTPPEERPVSSGQAPSGRTVLVAEDEEGVLALIERALTDQGYEVLTTRSASQALETLGGHEGKIDLLITDVIMPQVSGPQLVTRAWELGHDLRVLYITGYSWDSLDLPRILAEGDAYLEKPFGGQEVRDAVAQILSEPAD